ncbi:MAG: hypothetical protein Ct9H300mP1_26040 [Planctomycetaceae bacterium]|nr:MAG: hypothetical protein Ct9H300mP1_26040 [Planctomycetaceae bacterium]
MLIDLDRCTRCGSCVDACIAAHDDGNTRLYLDGPRFENFLVPLTCRKCLDPVWHDWLSGRGHQSGGQW